MASSSENCSDSDLLAVTSLLSNEIVGLLARFFSQHAKQWSTNYKPYALTVNLRPEGQATTRDKPQTPSSRPLTSPLQQPGHKKFKLSKIELIYRAKSLKVPCWLSRVNTDEILELRALGVLDYLVAQIFQYPLHEGYTFNYSRIPNLIKGTWRLMGS